MILWIGSVTDFSWNNKTANFLYPVLVGGIGLVSLFFVAICHHAEPLANLDCGT
jgi:hypothetical protein